MSHPLLALRKLLVELNKQIEPMLREQIEPMLREIDGIVAESENPEIIILERQETGTVRELTQEEYEAKVAAGKKITFSTGGKH